MSEQRREIAIERYQNAPTTNRCIEDRCVARRMKPYFANMLNICDLVTQQFGKAWRKTVIEKQFHPLDASGNSLSRTASAANRRAAGMSSLSRSG